MSSPVTLFAPGGAGDDLDHRMRYAALVSGTTIGFVYGSTGVDLTAHRREADRDAVEARAVAAAHGATRAIGFSRGARAVLGLLTSGDHGLSRAALVIPPGGTAAGGYATWLASSEELVDVDVLVVGHRGDVAHPARVAEAWASRLDARLELLPAGAVVTDVDRVASLLAAFLG